MRTPIALVAEDDPTDSLLLRWALKKAGVNARVRFVQDGVDVLEYLKPKAAETELGETVELLVLDLKMPRMGGFEVLEWLKLHPELRPRKILILSSSLSAEDIQQAGDYGIDHYLVKPTNTSELVNMVKRIEQYCPVAQEPSKDSAVSTSPGFVAPPAIAAAMR